VKVRTQRLRVTRTRRTKRAPSRQHQARAVAKSRVRWKNLLGLTPRQVAAARKPTRDPVRAAEQLVHRLFMAVRKASRWN
jgi:hypothetical protein